MSSLTALLEKGEASLPDPTPAQRTILSKLKDVRKRIEEGRLRVAVLGQFKRGKSTLLNALVGEPLLPTGITPVTSIPTYVSSGKRPSLRIEFEVPREPLEFRNASEFPALLARYVSESENPGNRERLRQVEIVVDANAFADSVILVDTPGVGSTFVHNTRAAEAVLSDCDVGIFVVSVDPPITEVELGYLDNIRRVVPKIFFVLNKVDLLDRNERSVAEAFLAKVLEDKLGSEAPDRIFSLSAKQALLAKQSGNASALAASGLSELERRLSHDLAREQRAIAFAAGRSRALSLVGELLYHGELSRKALVMPEQALKDKIADFEQSAAQFERERQELSDFLSLDRRRLLTEIGAMTDRVWVEARAKFDKIARAETEQGFDEREARERIGKALEQHFAEASRATTEKARAELVARLASHQSKAADLIAHVRQTAADLMEISVNLPPPDDAFELGHEPYWTAPAPSYSILDISALAFVRLMPRKIREERLRRLVAADTERASLRNVANLDWALRQNADDAFRRFEASLSQRLSEALDGTIQAMKTAVQRRSAMSAEVSDLAAQSEKTTKALKTILDELTVVAEIESRD
jgi:GTP-binding protein EngB required for normal cell division